MATYINWLDSITHNDEAPGSSPGVATTLARVNQYNRVIGLVSQLTWQLYESVLLIGCNKKIKE